MQFFLQYWYLKSFQRFRDAALSTIGAFDNTFAVKDTARNINKPLFQDYSYQGRIIGFFLRTGRILIGLVTYGLVIMAYLLLYILWLSFPFISLSSLVGGLIGGFL